MIADEKQMEDIRSGKTRDRARLEITAAMWATPQAHDCKPGDPSRVGRHKGVAGCGNLNDEAPMWSTLMLQDSEQAGSTNAAMVTLHRAAMLWSTPRTTTGKYTRDQGKKGSERLSLEGEAALWATPTSHERSLTARQVDHGIQLANQAESFPLSRQYQTISTSGEKSSADTRNLNPLFVEWLMGLPIGWTACEVSETELSHWKQRMRSLLSAMRSNAASEPVQLMIF
jgi:hypothetical protein